MWVSQKKNPEMMETDEKGKIGHIRKHTHTQTGIYKVPNPQLA